ncbi:hypothetical protein HYW75_00175 [Candidatus Pacearchaeota archaeon]|nr:hypothetical protein [Candidatus Pacearchaeota archaeon]
MEQVQKSLEDVYHRLIALENILKSKGIYIEKHKDLTIKEDDEGEMTDEFKAKLEKARQTPESEYIGHEEVKKRTLSRKK